MSVQSVDKDTLPIVVVGFGYVLDVAISTNTPIRIRDNESLSPRSKHLC